MKASYDPQADSLWVRWNTKPIEESDEVVPGVVVDYDETGAVVGIEVLNASKKIENLPAVGAGLMNNFSENLKEHL